MLTVTRYQSDDGKFTNKKPELVELYEYLLDKFGKSYILTELGTYVAIHSSKPTPELEELEGEELEDVHGIVSKYGIPKSKPYYYYIEYTKAVKVIFMVVKGIKVQIKVPAEGFEIVCDTKSDGCEVTYYNCKLIHGKVGRTIKLADYSSTIPNSFYFIEERL